MVLEAVQTLSIALLASDFTVVASLSIVCDLLDTNKKKNQPAASNNQKRNQQESSFSSSSNEQTSRQLPVRIELSDILSF